MKGWKSRISTYCKAMAVFLPLIAMFIGIWQVWGWQLGLLAVGALSWIDIQSDNWRRK